MPLRLGQFFPKQPLHPLLRLSRTSDLLPRKHLSQKETLEVVEADVPAPRVVVAKVFGR